MLSRDGMRKVGLFLGGFGVGAIVALVFAPKFGRETLELIAEKAGEGKDYLRARGKGLGRHAEQIWEQGKEALIEKKLQLVSALEAGRRAAFGR